MLHGCTMMQQCALHVSFARYSFVYDVDDEMGASRGRENHPCFYNASGCF